MYKSNNVLDDRIEAFRIAKDIKDKLIDLSIADKRKLSDYIRIVLENHVQSVQKK